MMNLLLTFVALLILFHNLVGIWGLMRQRRLRSHLLSIVLECIMGIIAFLFIFIQQKAMLILGFTGYRTLIILESAWISLRKQRPPSPLLPVNLLVVAGAITSYSLKADWIFLISYCIFWMLSWWIGKRLLHRAPIS